MTSESAAPLVISFVALAVSITSATIGAIRFRIDLRDRRRVEEEARPYFVLRGASLKQGDGRIEPHATLTNEGTVTAIQILASSWDTRLDLEDGNTVFMARADRLGPNESMDVTALLFESLSKLAAYPDFWGNRWRHMRVQVAYRLPHHDEPIVVAPLADLGFLEWAVREYLRDQKP